MSNNTIDNKATIIGNVSVVSPTKPVPTPVNNPVSETSVSESPTSEVVSEASPSETPKSEQTSVASSTSQVDVVITFDSPKKSSKEKGNPNTATVLFLVGIGVALSLSTVYLTNHGKKVSK